MIAHSKTNKVHKPSLDRIGLIKSVLQGFRILLDEELQPLGVTTAQLRLLWAIEENPQCSGAQLARKVSVTPQTGQATLARLEAHGWVRRQHSDVSDRVLVTELTTRGRRLLLKARQTAERMNRELWHGIPERDLQATESALKTALDRMGAEAAGH
jgi:DNA-binding MarR family transcriptional regulator